MFFVLHLNARLQPKHRFELEDALIDIFSEKGNVGEITGGGTEMYPNGEIKSCDIEIEFSDNPNDLEWLLRLLNHIGIAKGSVLVCGEKSYPVGSLEGLGLYLNVHDLPTEIYRDNDVNELISQLDNALDDVGRLLSWRELDAFTALYYYGTSFNEMNGKIANIISTHPLCKKSRIEKIA